MAVVCISLLDGHLGTKRLETFKSREASSATTSHMGSVLTNKVVRTQPDGQRVVVICRMECIRVGLRDCF
jgi:hypothetical protein